MNEHSLHITLFLRHNCTLMYYYGQKKNFSLYIFSVTHTTDIQKIIGRNALVVNSEFHTIVHDVVKSYTGSRNGNLGKYQILLRQSPILFPRFTLLKTHPFKSYYNCSVFTTILQKKHLLPASIAFNRTQFHSYSIIIKA